MPDRDRVTRPDRQTCEIPTRIAHINRFNALGHEA